MSEGAEKRKARKSGSPEVSRKPKVESPKSEEEEDNSAPDSYRDDALHSEIELQTANSKLQIETMEVHHHPEVEKKSVKEYILEGLMIFLAVTMGFFAEGLREHISDKAKESEYATSLKQDLKQDTTNLSKHTSRMDVQIAWIDSLILLLNKPLLNVNETNDAYFYARRATRKANFYITDRTVVQLKSAGTFRLIKNEELINSVLEYQEQNDSYLQSCVNDVTERGFLYPFISKIFDSNVFQTMVDNFNVIHRIKGVHHIKPVDKEFINQFIYYVHQLKSTYIVEKSILIDMKKQAKKTITIIQTDYDE
jgi:hypothetical protein